MISLCQIDAAVKRVRYYNPDLELELLFLDESELGDENLWKIAQIRGALVARVADIVNQASNQSQALDAAVSTVELLISSYNCHGDRPGLGHKPALQAIRLLASVSKRFDTALDLFFDLVERFCAQSRGQGRSTGNISDASASRTLQTYDQTLVKLISRQWSKDGRTIRWDVQKPIDRIKTLRKIYDFRDDNMSTLSVRTFSRRRQPSSNLFAESLQVLLSMRKRAVEMARATWIKSIAAHFRSWSNKKKPFDPTMSTISAASTGSTGSTGSTSSDVDAYGRHSTEPRRKFVPRDAEIIDQKQQVEMLCAVLEKNVQATVYNSKISDDSASNYTFSDDAASVKRHKTGVASSYHAS